MRTTIAPFASMILAFAATASAGNITFFDGTFNGGTCAPGVWCGSQVASNSGVTSSTFSFTNPLIGGAANDSAGRGDGVNKAWEQDTHSITGTDAGMRFLNINSSNTFTGSFSSLTYSYNLQNSGTRNVAYSIAILQNGNLYTSSPLDTVTPSGTNWSANGDFGRTNLSAASFFLVNGNLTLGGPMSAFNGTMEFGYLVSNSFVGGPNTGTYSSGIDNWSVTLNDAAPEPSSIALCCAGGVLAALSRLRRRGPKFVTRQMDVATHVALLRGIAASRQGQ